jgi:multidrug efflux pump subunit AcrA (membrane-fusion protein)
MKYRKLLTWVFILVIIGGGAALGYYLNLLKPEPSNTPPEKPLRLVQTRIVSYDQVNTSIQVPGRLASQRVVDVISEVQGKILEGDFQLKKGQDFRKGDLLCSIYAKELDLNIKAAKSRFLNALANALADIKFDYPERYDDVLEFFQRVEINQPLPEMPEINDQSLEVFLASRDILNQYYSIKVSEDRLARHFIRAPFDGTIMEVSLEVGGIANPGTRIAKIIKTDLLELEVPIEIEDLKWVSVGDKVKVVNEYRTSSWQGEVIRISEFLDPATQSASVFVQVRNQKNNPIYSGMFLEAHFDNKTVENAMEIPRQAVFNQNEVFIVSENALQKRKVNVHKINQNSVIFTGLEEGVEVVVEPLVNVKEGTVVKTDQI